MSLRISSDSSDPNERKKLQGLERTKFVYRSMRKTLENVPTTTEEKTHKAVQKALKALQEQPRSPDDREADRRVSEEIDVLFRHGINNAQRELLDDVWDAPNLEATKLFKNLKTQGISKEKLPALLDGKYGKELSWQQQASRLILDKDEQDLIEQCIFQEHLLEIRSQFPLLPRKKQEEYANQSMTHSLQETITAIKKQMLEEVPNEWQSSFKLFLDFDKTWEDFKGENIQCMDVIWKDLKDLFANCARWISQKQPLDLKTIKTALENAKYEPKTRGDDAYNQQQTLENIQNNISIINDEILKSQKKSFQGEMHPIIKSTSISGRVDNQITSKISDEPLRTIQLIELEGKYTDRYQKLHRFPLNRYLIIITTIPPDSKPSIQIEEFQGTNEEAEAFFEQATCNHAEIQFHFPYLSSTEIEAYRDRFIGQPLQKMNDFISEDLLQKIPLKSRDLFRLFFDFDKSWNNVTEEHKKLIQDVLKSSSSAWAVNCIMVWLTHTIHIVFDKKSIETIRNKLVATPPIFLNNPLRSYLNDIGRDNYVVRLPDMQTDEYETLNQQLREEAEEGSTNELSKTKKNHEQALIDCIKKELQIDEIPKQTMNILGNIFGQTVPSLLSGIMREQFSDVKSMQPSETHEIDTRLPKYQIIEQQIIREEPNRKTLHIVQRFKQSGIVIGENNKKTEYFPDTILEISYTISSPDQITVEIQEITKNQIAASVPRLIPSPEIIENYFSEAETHDSDKSTIASAFPYLSPEQQKKHTKYGAPLPDQTIRRVSNELLAQIPEEDRQLFRLFFNFEKDQSAFTDDHKKLIVKMLESRSFPPWALDCAMFWVNQKIMKPSLEEMNAPLQKCIQEYREDAKTSRDNLSAQFRQDIVRGHLLHMPEMDEENGKTFDTWEKDLKKSGNPIDQTVDAPLRWAFIQLLEEHIKKKLHINQISDALMSSILVCVSQASFAKVVKSIDNKFQALQIIPNQEGVAPNRKQQVLLNDLQAQCVKFRLVTQKIIDPGESGKIQIEQVLEFIQPILNGDRSTIPIGPPRTFIYTFSSDGTLTLSEKK